MKTKILYLSFFARLTIKSTTIHVDNRNLVLLHRVASLRKFLAKLNQHSTWTTLNVGDHTEYLDPSAFQHKKQSGEILSRVRESGEIFSKSSLSLLGRKNRSYKIVNIAYHHLK